MLTYAAYYQLRAAAMHTRAVEQQKTELEAALQQQHTLRMQQHTLRMQQQLDALAPDAGGGGACGWLCRG